MAALSSLQVNQSHASPHTKHSPTLLPQLPAPSTAQHGLAVTHVSFFPGRSTNAVVSIDRRGRMVLHSFSSLLLRTNVSSRVLIDGQYGAILALHHLVPFMLHTSAGGQGQAEGAAAEDPAKKYFFEVCGFKDMPCADTCASFLSIITEDAAPQQ